MKYWVGVMNWPLDSEWVCTYCGDRLLVWGLRHGECRCDTCHALYEMRTHDQENKVVSCPIDDFVPIYGQAFKAYYAIHKIQEDAMTDDMWDEAFVLIGGKNPMWDEVKSE